jgi:CxxC motif-containing protein
MMEMICICCPLGCRMTVEKTADGIAVSGNTCPRGKQYAFDELTAPKRNVTSSVYVMDGDYKTVSVKTDSPIAKELIFEALDTLKGITVTAPVAIGDVIVKNVLGTPVSFVATRNVNKI